MESTYKYTLTRVVPTRTEGARAFEAYCAVADLGGIHVTLSAPTIADLAEAWGKLFSNSLDCEHAQHVALVPWREIRELGTGSLQ